MQTLVPEMHNLARLMLCGMVNTVVTSDYMFVMKDEFFLETLLLDRVLYVVCTHHSSPLQTWMGLNPTVSHPLVCGQTLSEWYQTIFPAIKYVSHVLANFEFWERPEYYTAEQSMALQLIFQCNIYWFIFMLLSRQLWHNAHIDNMIIHCRKHL